VSKSSTYCLALALTLVLTLHQPNVWPTLAGSISPERRQPSLQVHVLLQNYAPVPTQALVEGQQLASHIFLQIGVEVVWVDKTQLREGSQTLEQVDLILRILPGPRTGQASKTALGEALPCKLNREGCFASVFYSRVLKLVQSEDFSLPQLLGHAMAHELGHLLLGSNSHSARGLMEGRWSYEDLRRAAKGDLVFSPQEAEVIRAHVAQRDRQTARAEGHQDRVTVRIWDLTRIENETIDRAKGVIERVFDPTGIQIVWLHCSVGEAPENSGLLGANRA
jgi:hypothetical protein